MNRHASNSRRHRGLSRPYSGCIAVACCIAGGVLAGCNSQTQGRAAPPAPSVDVAAAVERTLPDEEEFTGRLEAAHRVQVRPQVPGVIQQVHVVDGAVVARGARLVSIDPRPYETELARQEATLATARAQARLAQKEVQRANTLLSQQAVSRQEAEQLAASLETAQANVQQAEAAVRTARLNLEYTAVRAPLAGSVSRIEVTLGSLVNDQRLLTTLVGQGPVHAYFEVSEQTYRRLRKAPTIQREVRMGLADEAALPRRGRVDFIDNQLNPQSATVRLRASFDNVDGLLLPGLFARLRVTTSAPRPVVLTPDRAVGTDQNRKFVWVVGADGLPQPRPVTLGALIDGMRVLESGVRPGEDIAVGGLQRVRPGQPVAPTRPPLDDRGMPLQTAPAGGAATGGRP